MNPYPIITEPFTINENTFRFIKHSPVTYWNSISQQGVEKLVNQEWVKLDYEESSRIAKQFLYLYTSKLI